jgi:hypothetical protein
VSIPTSHGSTFPMSSSIDTKHEDIERQQLDNNTEKTVPVIKGLGWLDRFLAVWILLAMVVGVLLGNFVEQTGPALQKGKFVGVSIPIGIAELIVRAIYVTDWSHSYRTACDDVPNSMQSTLRDIASSVSTSRTLDPDWVQYHHELDCCTISHGKLRYLPQI